MSESVSSSPPSQVERRGIADSIAPSHVPSISISVRNNGSEIRKHDLLAIARTLKSLDSIVLSIILSTYRLIIDGRLNADDPTSQQEARENTAVIGNISQQFEDIEMGRAEFDNAYLEERVFILYWQKSTLLARQLIPVELRSNPDVQWTSKQLGLAEQRATILVDQILHAASNGSLAQGMVFVLGERWVRLDESLDFRAQECGIPRRLETWDSLSRRIDEQMKKRQQSTNRSGEPNSIDTTGLCLLSLDGGGVRGLSTLYILKNIMDRLNHARAEKKFRPVKPCEVFNLIGGTSTGGLIAIMLGRLEMDVDECIAAYSDLAEAVFGKKVSSLPFNFKGRVKSRFDSAKLETAIRKVVKMSGAAEDDFFNDGKERGCGTFVCTADRDTKDIVRLRSYSLPHEPNIRATICQAALATSAATTFFDPVSISDRSFADGGLGANNPVDEVEGEASNIWCTETGDLKPLVKCFISIGTGNPGKKAFEDSMAKFLSETVVQIATETENTERRFIARYAKQFDEKRYFRFNVEQGLQNIGLDEYRKKGALQAATEGYITHRDRYFRVRDCIRNLTLKQSVYCEAPHIRSHTVCELDVV